MEEDQTIIDKKNTIQAQTESNDDLLIHDSKLKIETHEYIKSEDGIKICNANYNDYDKGSDLQSLETYLKAIQLEFKDYFNKYKKLFDNITENTVEYFKVFDDLIIDYSSEMTQNTALLHDVFSKLNEISNEMPQLEELYQKVREMRIGLEYIYKQVKR
jgi:hypothetical protein